MGNSSKSSQSSSSSNGAYFSSDSHCNCSTCYWYSERIATKSYHLKGDAGLTAGRAIAGIFTFGLSEAGYGIYKGVTNAGDGLNHYYVIVYYRCDNCNDTFRKVYEWFGNDYSDIKERFGCYQNYDNDRRNMYKRISYDTIESYFNSSKSRNYDYCQIYANELYDKLYYY